MSIRAVKSISQSQLTLEGAGVKLRRAFGFGRTSDFDGGPPPASGARIVASNGRVHEAMLETIRG